VREAWAKFLLLGLAPLLFLEGIRLMVGAPFTWGGLATRWGFVVGMLVVAALTRPHSLEGTRWHWPGLLWLGPGAVAGLVYGRTGVHLGRLAAGRDGIHSAPRPGDRAYQ
jgi:hypothetical protein